MGVVLSNIGVVVKESEVSERKESLSDALAAAISSARRIKKAAIINLINHIHFTGGFIQVHIGNTATGEELIAAASPEPCANENLTARWLKHDNFNPADYTLLNILINDGKSMVLAPVDTISITDDLFIAALPERGRIWNRRQNRRYSANTDIDVEIIQDNNRIEGSLKDFNSSGFCIKLDSESLLFFDKFDISKPFFIKLSGEEIIYSGFSSYVKEDFNGNDRLIVLKLEEAAKHLIKRENRNPRLKLVPTPKIVFKHPFLNKTIEIELVDISSSGFAVQLSIDESLLMPTLFIKELFIVINGSINLRCTASIVYQLKVDENNFKYGFSILEMEMNMFNQLFAIICNADNPCVNLSPKLDLDSLWEFFFKSKFIYPKKYKLIGADSGEIRDIYSKLYQKGREIFTYITYQENGKILGHCSMIRAYQRSWLVQHLAAISAENTRFVGIHIVNQVFNYVDSMFKLPSSKMDYLMFYYRPDNKFSDYFFGGFYKELNSPTIVSQDTFAYLSCPLRLSADSLPKDFIIEEINIEDYDTLDKFYQKQSGGGLFIKSLGLNMEFNEEPLEEIYKKMQLTRTCRVYSLREHDKLKAVFIIDRSDIGINMSELLNCIKIIIIDMNLSWEILNSAINVLGRIYSNDNVSVMIYPTEYLNLNSIITDRYYNLWITDSKYGYEYLNFLKQRANPRLPSLLM
jgi:hypothetical protein